VVTGNKTEALRKKNKFRSSREESPMKEGNVNVCRQEEGERKSSGMKGGGMRAGTRNSLQKNREGKIYWSFGQSLGRKVQCFYDSKGRRDINRAARRGESNVGLHARRGRSLEQNSGSQVYVDLLFGEKREEKRDVFGPQIEEFEGWTLEKKDTSLQVHERRVGYGRCWERKGTSGRSWFNVKSKHRGEGGKKYRGVLLLCQEGCYTEISIPKAMRKRGLDKCPIQLER